MEAVEKVSSEVDKVITKFTAISEHSSKLISNEISSLELLKSSLLDQPADSSLTSQQVTLVKNSLSRTKERLQRLGIDHRDLHGTVSKVGKAIERNFTAEYTSITRQDLFQNKRNIELLDKNIVQHFYRQGMDDVAESLVKEAKLPKEEISEEPYAELHRIFEDIHQRNLTLAIQWATKYSNELDEKNSPLLFKLHRLQFLQILMNGLPSQNEAINYARNNISHFVSKYPKDFQALMGCLLYLKTGLENSPYKYLVRDEMWIEAADLFLKDACALAAIAKESPLSVIINAGCVALPALLNLKQVMNRQVQGIWSGRDELPIEIEVERYHSIFACPILRQQSTDENPPMRLRCGHVISRDALNKLSSASIMNNNHYRSLKCPYCPMEQSINDAKQINF
ncbi:CLUMA_CG000983, isoform A [Clunio marinus]|uniref:CLUMA_CG000983, isoform A n=1 Tax=Clunio marinus TaxID=568069 RepID=A0A1J1HGN6_9DIPT|nr:CLUMA_CG000983, isoform A [Clunio marinus]